MAVDRPPYERGAGVDTPPRTTESKHGGRGMLQRWIGQSGATVMALVLVTVASNAGALIVDGGPFYAGSGGVSGSCTVSGTPSLSGGAMITCTGLNPNNFQNLYFGIRNDQFVNGETMTGVAPAANSGAVYRIAGTSGNSQITYAGTTSVFDSVSGTHSVTTNWCLRSPGGRPPLPLPGATRPTMATAISPTFGRSPAATSPSSSMRKRRMLRSRFLGFRVQPCSTPAVPVTGSMETSARSTWASTGKRYRPGRQLPRRRKRRLAPTRRR